MRFVKIMFLVICSLVFFGCAIKQPLNKQNINRMSDSEVCFEYEDRQTEILKKELIKRDLVEPVDFGLIKEGKITQGLTTCALFLSWGAPYDKRTTYYAGSSTELWIYGSPTARYSAGGALAQALIGKPIANVYVRNGRIVAIQSP